ncbi:hypothetical protein PSPO_a1788 [Pseudoalteromonas spongiae UST010723-006]|nr:hypothetical protein PSPO_a1788 [Pseudoalteromonas spongiae UST010723-006]
MLNRACTNLSNTKPSPPIHVANADTNAIMKNESQILLSIIRLLLF